MWLRERVFQLLFFELTLFLYHTTISIKMKGSGFRWTAGGRGAPTCIGSISCWQFLLYMLNIFIWGRSVQIKFSVLLVYISRVGVIYNSSAISCFSLWFAIIFRMARFLFLVLLNSRGILYLRGSVLQLNPIYTKHWRLRICHLWLIGYNPCKIIKIEQKSLIPGNWVRVLLY